MLIEEAPNALKRLASGAPQSPLATALIELLRLCEVGLVPKRWAAPSARMTSTSADKQDVALTRLLALARDVADRVFPEKPPPEYALANQLLWFDEKVRRRGPPTRWPRREMS